jgi:hypothetical protein
MLFCSENEASELKKEIDLVSQNSVLAVHAAQEIGLPEGRGSVSLMWRAVAARAQRGGAAQRDHPRATSAP